MRVKTCITLPGALLAEIDKLATTRSAFLELAAQAHVAKITKAKPDAKDLEMINRRADQLNREAEEILEFQRLPFYRERRISILSCQSSRQCVPACAANTAIGGILVVCESKHP